MNSKVFLPALPGMSPDGDGYFGSFGRKFIPEALVAATRYFEQDAGAVRAGGAGK